MSTSTTKEEQRDGIMEGDFGHAAGMRRTAMLLHGQTQSVRVLFPTTKEAWYKPILAPLSYSAVTAIGLGLSIMCLYLSMIVLMGPWKWASFFTPPVVSQHVVLTFCADLTFGDWSQCDYLLQGRTASDAGRSGGLECPSWFPTLSCLTWYDVYRQGLITYDEVIHIIVLQIMGLCLLLFTIAEVSSSCHALGARLRKEKHATIILSSVLTALSSACSLVVFCFGVTFAYFTPGSYLFVMVDNQPTNITVVTMITDETAAATQSTGMARIAAFASFIFNMVSCILFTLWSVKHRSTAASLRDDGKEKKLR